MVAIAMTIVSTSACLFLTFALVQFNLEHRRLRSRRSLPIVAAWKLGVEQKNAAHFPSCSNAEEPTQQEAHARREVLVTGFLGFLGLAAPFIFILLLSSSMFRR